MQYICILRTIKDWMMLWIKLCQHYGHRLKWEFVSSLVIQDHHNGDPNVTKKEIDLAYGLRDLQVILNVLINSIFFNSLCNNLYMLTLLNVKHHKDFL